MFRNRLGKNGRLFFSGSVLAAIMITSAAMAIENKPLPSFEVKNASGSTVDSSSWKIQGKWVVIYLEGRCAPCTHLLVRLTKDKYPQLARQTIIIVGGVQAGDVKVLEKEFPDLAQAKWYADPERNAHKALNLHGAPVTLGIQDKILRWAISGVPPSPRLLPSVLKKWSSPQDEALSHVPTTPPSSSR
jgi:hypothetical protein